jgi:hypothetical protein
LQSASGVAAARAGGGCSPAPSEITTRWRGSPAVPQDAFRVTVADENVLVVAHDGW